MLPPPMLWTRKLPGAVVMAPPEATAPIRMAEDSRESLGGETTVEQSPTILQSLCGTTAAKRGTGAVAEAVVTEETGARAMVSWATAGGVKRGKETNVGNCADSCVNGLASATS